MVCYLVGGFPAVGVEAGVPGVAFRVKIVRFRNLRQCSLNFMEVYRLQDL